MSTCAVSLARNSPGGVQHGHSLSFSLSVLVGGDWGWGFSVSAQLSVSVLVSVLLSIGWMGWLVVGGWWYYRHTGILTTPSYRRYLRVGEREGGNEALLELLSA